MTKNIRFFFTKSLKSAATNCNSNQRAIVKAEGERSQSVIIEKNKKKLKEGKSLKKHNSKTKLDFDVQSLSKKRENIVPFPKPLYNSYLSGYTDNSKLKEMLFKGTDVSPYTHGVKNINSYERHKSKHLADLIEKESFKKLLYDLLVNKSFAFINFQPLGSKNKSDTKSQEDDLVLNELEYILSEIKQAETKDKKHISTPEFSSEFLLYTKGVDSSGGCSSLGLNLPTNDEDPYKQFSFKNKYGASLPIELIQLKNYLPEVSCYSLQYMGYDKDWYEFAKALMTNVHLRNEIVNKLQSLKTNAMETKK